MKGRAIGVVKGLFVCSDKALPMASVEHVRAMEGRGLGGDRYALGRGAFSRKPGKIRQVSLISAEAIELANTGREIPYFWHETRRNIVVSGIDLDERLLLEEPLIRVGSAVLQVVDDCAPCNRPDMLSGKKGFSNAFQGLGGLRAQVLASGDISIGDLVEIDKTD
ncbi:sulfurase [Candidatus Saccharibacteria bacterium]|nr:sulfurase [Candidatus Saccharibacteria bacterium]